MNRDLRIDFFRGLALLSILANHIDLVNQTWHIQWSLKWLFPGLSDAAEIFVFLSGYVCGLVYYAHLQRAGWATCMRKALSRIIQIYRGYLLGCFTVLVLLSVNPILPSSSNVLPGGFALFLEAPTHTLAHLFTLSFSPDFFNILPMYMVILLVMPSILLLMRKSMMLALVASFAVYVAVQFEPTLNLPAWSGAVSNVGVAEGADIDHATLWAFNPFAWQFLFTLGMGLSIAIKFHYVCLPKRNGLILLATLLVVMALIPRLTQLLYNRDIMPFAVVLEGVLFDKQNLGIVRLVHFFAMAYLVFAWLPKHSQLLNHWLASPIILTGQKSLDYFLLGVCFTYLSKVILDFIGLSFATVNLVSLGLIATLLVIATRPNYQQRANA